MNQAQQAKKKTDVASFLEELNLAYTDAYADYMDTGNFSHVMNMTDVYNKLPTEVKDHVYSQNGDKPISLSNSSQTSVVLLSNSAAIGSDGASGHNTQSVSLIEGENNSTNYWGEVKGKYYPIILDTTNSKIRLDEENARDSQPEGTTGVGTGITINYKDNGAETASGTSNVVNVERTGTTLNISAKAEGTTKLVIKNGNTPLTEGEITVTVNPVYDVAITAGEGGSVAVTTGGVSTATTGKYGKNVAIVVTATKNAQKKFKQWSDDTTITDNTRNLTITANLTLEATFEDAPEPVSASTMAASPSTYYGNAVSYSGYTGSNYSGGWEIFHATSSNIYLIATGTPETSALSISGYNGTSDFTAASTDTKNISNFPAVADGWLNKTYSGSGTTIAYPSAYNNMLATEYLLDSKDVWNSKYGTTASKWVIGGPTMELLVASCNAVKGDGTYTIENPSGNGYVQTISSGLTNPSVWNHGTSYWLACPSSDDSGRVRYVYNTSAYVSYLTYGTPFGLRPVVCLKSGVQLERSSSTSPWTLNTTNMTN